MNISTNIITNVHICGRKGVIYFLYRPRGLDQVLKTIVLILLKFSHYISRYIYLYQDILYLYIYIYIYK